MKDEHANIMVLGRTGAGKSTFINYLLGKDECPTGIGTPITQGFDAYEYDEVKSSDALGLPLRIYDSKGLEAEDYPTIKQDIITFVKQQCGSKDVYQWIHSIFYCVNVGGKRFESTEASFIKSLSGEVSQTVHVVLTHCEQTPDGFQQIRAMNERIRSQLEDTQIRIYCVNSIMGKDRGGTYPPFGRDEILKQLVELLWSDICHKIAKSYAKEIRPLLVRRVEGIQKYYHSYIKNFSTFKLMFSNDSFNKKYNDQTGYLFIEDIVASTREVDRKYHETLQILAYFCIRYGKRPRYHIKKDDPFSLFDFGSDTDSIVPDINIFEDLNIGKLLDEIDNMENAADILITFGKSAISFALFKARLRRNLDNQIQHIRASIPDEQTIEADMYAKLMEAYQG